MGLLFICYCSLAGFGVVFAVLTWIQTWEHGRYHHRRLRTPNEELAWPPVALTVPCKGIDLDLADNLKALFSQDYPVFELYFVVESPADPSIRVIEEVREQYPDVACRVIVAGLAADCGQKVHNLITATQQISDSVEVLAFADSDAHPQPHWLKRIVRRALHRRTGVASGYRWFIPERPTLSNRIVAAMNNQIAGNLGLRLFNLVWGGSWAMRREVFDSLGLPDAWRGSLNDDLMVASLVRKSGMKVVYEPHCLVTSAVDFDFHGMLEFSRRQYLQVRVFTPRWWWLALGVASTVNFMYFGSALLAIFWAVTGGPYLWPLAYATIYYLSAMSGTAIRQRAIEPFLAVDPKTFRNGTRYEMLTGPVTALFHLVGIIASRCGNRIVWRGIHYYIVGPNRTVIESHPTAELATTVTQSPDAAADRAA